MLATSITAKDPGSDPPDREGLDANGELVAIEATELVDSIAIKAAKAGQKNAWASWPREKLLGRIQARLTKKDGSTLLGGPYAAYVVVIHTDEAPLPFEHTRDLIGATRFTANRITRAYLLISYDPKLQRQPFIELLLERGDTAQK